MNGFTLKIEIWHIFLIFLMTSCSSLCEEPLEIASSVPHHSEVTTAIDNYMMVNKNLTRADGYEVVPYVEQGDTLMYIVNYDEGWEIFSNSLNMPMSLVKSEMGKFTNDLISVDTPFSAIFKGIKTILSYEKKNPGEKYAGCEQWGVYLQNSSNQQNNENLVYTHVGTKTYPRVSYTIPHLLKTHWFQSAPFNNHMPFQSKNMSERQPVGCGAVAAGQFLYYTHYKWGKPSLAPSIATYNAAGNYYVFSNLSPLPWDNMILYYFQKNSQYTSIFLSWIAKEIKSKEEYDGLTLIGNASKLSDISKFINSQTGFSTSTSLYSASYVSNMLLNYKPVILFLEKGESGHYVVADAVDYTCQEYDYYYAFIEPSSNTDPDPTMPPGPSTSPDDDYDFLVAKYGTVYTEHRKDETSYFKFNWGADGDIDTSFNGAILDISITTLDGVLKFHILNMLKYDIN